MNRTSHQPRLQVHLLKQKCREMPLAHADQERNSNIAVVRFSAAALLVLGLAVVLYAPYLYYRLSLVRRNR